LVEQGEQILVKRIDGGAQLGESFSHGKTEF
jgi:hypothetical protein